jgi:hypothetical protein
MLSRLSFALQDAQFKAAIKRHATRDEILDEARRIDAALAAGPDRNGVEVARP